MLFVFFTCYYRSVGGVPSDILWTRVVNYFGFRFVCGSRLFFILHYVRSLCVTSSGIFALSTFSLAAATRQTDSDTQP